MQKNAAKDAARTAKRDARLGGEDAVCVLCKFSDRDALVPTKRTLVEAHHVLGRQYDGKITVPLCRNCHAIVTEKLRRAGVSMQPPPTLLERLVNLLRAAGVMLVALGQAFLDCADDLVRWIFGFDQVHPDWRHTLGEV